MSKKWISKKDRSGNVKHIPIEEDKPPVDKKTVERVVNQWIKVEKKRERG